MPLLLLCLCSNFGIRQCADRFCFCFYSLHPMVGRSSYVLPRCSTPDASLISCPSVLIVFIFFVTPFSCHAACRVCFGPPEYLSGRACFLQDANLFWSNRPPLCKLYVEVWEWVVERRIFDPFSHNFLVKFCTLLIDMRLHIQPFKVGLCHGIHGIPVSPILSRRRVSDETRQAK